MGRDCLAGFLPRTFTDSLSQELFQSSMLSMPLSFFLFWRSPAGCVSALTCTAPPLNHPPIPSCSPLFSANRGHVPLSFRTPAPALANHPPCLFVHFSFLASGPGQPVSGLLGQALDRLDGPPSCPLMAIMGSLHLHQASIDYGALLPRKTRERKARFPPKRQCITTMTSGSSHSFL